MNRSRPCEPRAISTTACRFRLAWASTCTATGTARVWPAFCTPVEIAPVLTPSVAPLASRSLLLLSMVVINDSITVRAASMDASRSLRSSCRSMRSAVSSALPSGPDAASAATGWLHERSIAPSGYTPMKCGGGTVGWSCAPRWRPACPPNSTSCCRRSTRCFWWTCSAVNRACRQAPALPPAFAAWPISFWASAISSPTCATPRVSSSRTRKTVARSVFPIDWRGSCVRA